MSFVSKVVLLLLFLALLCLASPFLYLRLFNRTDLTVEVLNLRAETVQQVTVIYGLHECSRGDLAPGQTVTCHYDISHEGAPSYRYGVPPQTHSPTDTYVMGGRKVINRYTLEADGGASVSCNRYCVRETLPDPPND